MLSRQGAITSVGCITCLWIVEAGRDRPRLLATRIVLVVFIETANHQVRGRPTVRSVLAVNAENARCHLEHPWDVTDANTVGGCRWSVEGEGAPLSSRL